MTSQPLKFEINYPEEQDYQKLLKEPYSSLIVETGVDTDLIGQIATITVSGPCTLVLHGWHRASLFLVREEEYNGN